MTPEQFARIDDVFRRAVALDDSERQALLDETCADEPTVRARVEALLARDRAPHPFLDIRPEDPLPPATDVAMPTRIGTYRILDVLGTGASGVVYRALQDTPRRFVALKVLRDGLSRGSAQARFRREAEVLARLQHPGVAHVIEAGTTAPPDARPYLVMEHVDGRPLLEHVAHYDLDVRRRLELLLRVCDAVEHAHLHGVVHRDLKPSNILVRDEETTTRQSIDPDQVIGQPKVLDFGIARFVTAERVGSAPTTAVGELVGTLPYMSPEQFAGDPDAVDARCDVHALGVLLFELLTGQRPHDLAGRSFGEGVRILTQEPPRRLVSVDRRFRGDLDVIAATALARDVDARYATVAAFAGDLRRHLADEPILARPPSTAYHVVKFARRQRGLVASVLGAFVLLATALAAIATLYARSEQRAEAMRRAMYGQEVMLAQHAFDTGDVRSAVAHLDACPPDLRHWEWARLRALTEGSSEVVLRGHTGIVNDVAVRLDLDLVVTAGGFDDSTPPAERERTIRVWRASDGQLLRTLPAQENAVRAVAFDRSGATVLSLTGTRAGLGDAPNAWLRQWRVDDGTLLAEQAVTAVPRGALATFDDGWLVAGPLGRVAFVRPHAGEGFDVRWVVPGTSEPVATDVATWVGGPTVASRAERGAASDRSASGGPSGAGSASDGPVSDGPTDALVVVTAWFGDVTAIDGRTGDVRWSTAPAPRDVAHAVAIAPDGRRVAVGSKDRRIRILDAATGHTLATSPDLATIPGALAFTADGTLFSGGADGVVRRHDPTTLISVDRYIGHRDAIRRLRAVGDGRLATAADDGTVRLWRIGRADPDAIATPHGINEVNESMWSPDGRWIATAGDDGHVRVRDAATGADRLALPMGERFVHSVAWAPDGRHLAAVGGAGRVGVWSVDSPEPIALTETTFDVGARVVFAPDGTTFAVAARGALTIWDATTGTLRRTLADDAMFRDAAWSLDGSSVLAADTAGRVRRWRASDGATLGGLPAHELAVDSVARSHDGAWIATGDRGGTVRIWTADGRLHAEIAAHRGACERVAFSPDDARLLSAGRDGLVRLFTTATGEPRLTLDGHRSGALGADWHPSGDAIVSAGQDAVVRVWWAVPRGAPEGGRTRARVEAAAARRP